MRDVLEVPAVSYCDILGTCEDGCDAPQHLLLCENCGYGAAVEQLNLPQYKYEEICLKPDQRVDLVHLVQDICKRHSKDLAKSLQKQEYQYALGPRTVLVRVKVNSKASSLFSQLDETEFQKTRKS